MILKEKQLDLIGSVIRRQEDYKKGKRKYWGFFYYRDRNFDFHCVNYFLFRMCGNLNEKNR
ncbi:MAG: hypothetical protein ACRC8J_06635, partial [Phocaeicola sp.]